MLSCKSRVALLFFLTLFLSCSDGDRMRGLMEHVDSLNQCYASLADDSVMPSVVSWMDRHGTANERMRAHYLLAAVYRDRGEAPESLGELQTAAQCADTTAADCDYHTLSRVHGQMAELFVDQYLPHEMMNAEWLCQYYAWKNRDTLMWLISNERQSDYYVLLGKRDSAIHVLKNAYEKYKQFGYSKEAVNCIESLPLYLAEQGLLEEAKYYMTIFEKYSDNYDTATSTACHVPYYYIKGMVYLSSSYVDSSLVFFRKILLSTQNSNTIEMAYKGIYQAYMKMGQNDSAAKYADLCYRTCDDYFQNSTTEKLRRMQALYNYSRHQHLAQEKEKEASRMRQILIIIGLSAFVLIMLLLFVLYHIYTKRKQQIATLTKEYEYRIQQIQNARNELAELDIISLHGKKQEELDESQRKLLELLGLEKVHGCESVNLFDNDVYRYFCNAVAHPGQKVDEEHWESLHSLFDKKIPCFRDMLTHGKKISEKDYRLCMLIRMQFGVLEICTLMDTYSQYVSVRRRQLLEKYYNIKGKPEDFDKIVMMIR